MTDDTSPENLRKFLESDDPAMRMMGLSMAKGSGVPEDLLPTILRLYLWEDDKAIRAAAKSVFTKYAPIEQEKIKENWKPSYRTLSITGNRFLEAIRPFLEAFKSQNQFVEIALMPLTKALGQSVGQTVEEYDFTEVSIDEIIQWEPISALPLSGIPFFSDNIN